MSIQTFTLTDSTSGETCEFEVMNIESLNQQWGRDDSRITVQYKILWSKRFVARRLLLGTTKVTATAGTAHLTRTVPHSWIESDIDPVSGTLYATKITNTRGLETLAQPSCYRHAIITVVYEDLPYVVRPDDAVLTTTQATVPIPDESTLRRWIEFGPRTGEGRIIQSYGAGAIYSDNNKPVLNGNPFPYYEETFTLIWHQVPWNFVPWSRLSTSVNKINSTSFYYGAANTIMFVGFDPVMTRLPNDTGQAGIDRTRAANVKMKFKYNVNGWNRLPDPTRSYRWYPVVMKHDPTKTLFDTMDFASLFRTP